MLVAVVPPLLDEDHLIDPGVRKASEMLAQLVGGADPAVLAIVGKTPAHLLVAGPDVGAARLVISECIEVPERKAEETESIQAPALGLIRIRVARKARHHGDVGVDRVTDRHALRADDPVVVVDPVLGLLGIDEREGQRPDAESGREMDGLAVRAGHPDRRVRLLDRLRHQVAARHLEVLALVARVGIHAEHVGRLLDALEPHLALLVDRNPEALDLLSRGRLSGAEVHPAVRDQVQRRDAFGDTRGVVVARGHHHDAGSEPNSLRALGAGGQKHLGRRRMRVLLEKVVLDLPGVIDPEPVGQFDLVQRLLEELLFASLDPRPRELVFVEDPELHEAFPS